MNYTEIHLAIVKHLVEHTFKHTYKTDSIEDILWDVASNCVKLLDFEDCVIYLYDNDKNVLVQKAAFGPKHVDNGIVINPMQLRIGQGIVGSVAQSCQAEVINDCTQDPRYVVDDISRGSEISVPLVFDGKLVGIIDSEHSEKHFFKPVHLDILESISSICAIKIAEMQANAKNQVLARFFNETPHPTLRIDSNGAILNRNKAAEKVLKQWNIVDNKICDATILQLIDSVLSKDTDDSVEIAIADDIFNLSFHPVSDRQYVNVYSSNVTALKNAKEEAEHSNKTKSKFLSVISHEIRTPLNAIIGTLNLLKSENPTDKQLEYLNTTDFASDKLLTLLNNVLDDEKIEADKMEIENVHFNLRALVSNLKNAFIFETNSANNNLEFIIENNIYQSFYGDETKLFQILINLLNNAIKFTENGSITIKIKEDDNHGNSCKLRFEVADTGIGIPPEKLESIFNPFQQAENSITRRFGGTGLGLSIAKDLVELLGGTLSVESEAGQGTTFTMILELIKSDEDSTAAYRQHFKFDSEALANVKVLLVDDNGINLRIGEQFLKKWGATVLKAENGIEAFKVFEKHDLDLILMDIHMPVCNGYEATKKIRKSKRTNNDIPIIATTADVTKQSQLLARQAGINDIIFKPFKPENFLKRIKSALVKQECV